MLVNSIGGLIGIPHKSECTNIRENRVVCLFEVSKSGDELQRTIYLSKCPWNPDRNQEKIETVAVFGEMPR
jgi:hypothetical protein